MQNLIMHLEKIHENIASPGVFVLTNYGMSERQRYITERNLPNWTQLLLSQLGNTKGRRQIPLPAANTALIAVDLQKIFLSPSSPAYLPSWEAIKSNCMRLITTAINNNIPVILTRHQHDRKDEGGTIKFFFGRLILSDDPMCKFIDAVNKDIMEKSHIIVKSRHSAFSNPTLESLLKKLNVKFIVIGGVQAELCVLATAVEAGTHEFIPIVVPDAICSKKEILHISAVIALSGGISGIMTTQEVIEKWL